MTKIYTKSLFIKLNYRIRRNFNGFFCKKSEFWGHDHLLIKNPFFIDFLRFFGYFNGFTGNWLRIIDLSDKSNGF